MASENTGPGSFGQRLRRLRHVAELTQQELAKSSGISVDEIYKLENGHILHPRRDTLAMLSDALGLDPADRQALATAARRKSRPQGPRVPGRLPERAAVILSHTSELREHPAGHSFVDAAEAAVIRAGHTVIDMAYFGPNASPPSHFCKAMVARADVYVGIIGVRYGMQVPDRPELSYTELEFEAATKGGLPRLVFVVRDEAPSMPLVSQSAEHQTRQEAFRHRLQDAGVTIAWVATPDELQLELFQALVELKAAARPVRATVLESRSGTRPAPIPPSNTAPEPRRAAGSRPRRAFFRDRFWGWKGPARPKPDRKAYMQDPLRKGDVWIAWDHQARLKDALADTKDFVAVPAPRGPRSLGYLSVVVGLAIPRDAPNKAGAEALIDYLTRPAQQAAASSSLGFFPVVQGVKLAGLDVPPYLNAEANVAAEYASDKNAVVALLPVGLGSKSDQFTLTYQETFKRIILGNEDIRTVLNDEASKLQALLDAAKAPCWPPDLHSAGTCHIN